jgi:hypothetical protein
MAASSIDTGLQPIPDLTDITTADKLAFQFIQLYNAVGILAQAIDSYTGNTPAIAQNQNASPEQTVLLGNQANMWCVAATNLAAGYLVNLENVGGATQARYAQATGLGSMAMGITMGAASGGGQVQVLLLGLFNFGGSVTPGAIYYLSNTVPGGLTTTYPGGTGYYNQAVGFGVDTDSIFFNPSMQILGSGPIPT